LLFGIAVAGLDVGSQLGYGLRVARVDQPLDYRKSWRTREEAENALFAYIDGWYNTERIQARLGWRSPDEYEAAWHADQHHHPAADAAEPDPAAAR
jgi:putative transposase